jgi:hypothetical protein
MTRSSVSDIVGAGRRMPKSTPGLPRVVHAGWMNVAMAASIDFLELDDGWPALRAALLVAGLRPRVVVWDDPSVEWGTFELVVAMYAWGYVTQRTAFLAWVEGIETVTRLANSAAHLRWNSDKTYLADLADLAIPVVETTWARPGQAWSPPAEDYVIKPTVASGGLGAARYQKSPLDRAERHVRRLHQAGHTAMIQPYQARIDISGETALVYLGDRFSHAINKAPLLRPDVGETDRLWEQQVITPTAPAPAHRDLADAVMSAVISRLGPTAYARVDLVEDNTGTPRLLEVELVEPALFLRTADGSTPRLAEVLRQVAVMDA